MYLFERKIENNIITLILCLKNEGIRSNKCIIKHIYEKCNKFMQISDFYQSSIISNAEIAALEFKCESFHKIESDYCNLVFYESGFMPINPRINYKDKFSFFIDKKMFLPSFVHLFVHYCMEEVDCFSNPELFTKKNARLPLLTIEEQKSFLINLFNM